jgi:aminoglycoside 2''-phosphotransferase
MELLAARRALGAAFPGLPLRSVRILPGGWDFLTLEVDRTWVFRFPVRPSSEERIRREFSLLPLLAARLGVPVPEYRFRREPRGAFPHRFGGYTKLRGIRVDRARLSSRALARTGRELGAALTALHRVPRAAAVGAGIHYRPAVEVRDRFLRWGRKVRREVRPLLGADSRRRMDELWDRASAARLWSFRTALIHNDLLPVHVLVAAPSGAITGIIDWGDVEFGDPAFDFGVMGRLPHLGPAVYHAYGNPIDPGFRERVDLYGRVVVSHAVLYATQTGDQEYRARSVRRLARALNSSEPGSR